MHCLEQLLFLSDKLRRQLVQTSEAVSKSCALYSRRMLDPFGAFCFGWLIYACTLYLVLMNEFIGTGTCSTDHTNHSMLLLIIFFGRGYFYFIQFCINSTQFNSTNTAQHRGARTHSRHSTFWTSLWRLKKWMWQLLRNGDTLLRLGRPFPSPINTNAPTTLRVRDQASDESRTERCSHHQLSIALLAITTKSYTLWTWSPLMIAWHH